MIARKREDSVKVQTAGTFGPHARVPFLRESKPSRGYRLWRMQPRGRLGEYYLDWHPHGGVFGEDWSNSPRDERGVLVTPRKEYHPLRIAQYALFEHARSLRERDERAGESFLAQARWLREAVLGDNPGGNLPIPFPASRFAPRAGILSARAQSEAISVLLRAHEIEPLQGFLEAAARAALPFNKTIEEGGVVWRSASGDTFLEEVATLPAAHVLGGGIVGFWGIFELARFAQIAWIGEVLGSTIGTLQRRIRHYDSGYWSYESALTTRSGYRPVATLQVHDLHIAALRVCASMTGDAQFNAIAESWSGHLADARARMRVLTNVCVGTLANGFAHAEPGFAGARTVF